MSTGHFQKLPQSSKFFIGSVPEHGEEAITVEAQFNPKELQIESPIGWHEHKVIAAQSVATKPMEFTGMGAETVKVELTFDAFEEDDDAVVDAIAQLKRLASVRVPNQPGSKGKAQRPSFCVATWGTQQPFRCVIESINVKYTMFSFDGTPVRAIVVLGLKSGRRTLDENAETSFEKASRERLEAQRDKLQKQRDQRESERRETERARERRYAEERAAREQATAYDRRLAEREARAHAEMQEIEATRYARDREKLARDQRIIREQQVAEKERAVAAERERERREREQREKDLDLE